MSESPVSREADSEYFEPYEHEHEVEIARYEIVWVDGDNLDAEPNDPASCDWDGHITIMEVMPTPSNDEPGETTVSRTFKAYAYFPPGDPLRAVFSCDAHDVDSIPSNFELLKMNKTMHELYVQDVIIGNPEEEPLFDEEGNRMLDWTIDFGFDHFIPQIVNGWAKRNDDKLTEDELRRLKARYHYDEEEETETDENMDDS